LCEDGWFCSAGAPTSQSDFLPIDFHSIVASAREQAGVGNWNAAISARSALLGLLSFYMKGAPASWGPLLDEVASAVSSVDAILDAWPDRLW
jgi:hypothetical protein